MYICTKCEANRQALVDQGAPENSLPQVMYDKWANRCPACGNFNTLTLRTDDEDSEQKFTSWVETDTEAVLISSVEKKELPRISTNTREFDRVLGGGIVIGSTVLLGGEPGAGKSTLMIQTCGDLSTAETTDDEGKPSKIKVLYVSAEETKSQIKDRGDRVSTEFGEVFENAPVDLVLVGTPIDLTRILKINKPSQRVRYELQEIGQPTLEDILRAKFPG